MSVLILRPNSDSSVAQTKSTGSYNYALIDETTKDEADYTYNYATKNAPATTKRDLYGFPNHTSESGTINSVTIKAYCKGIRGTAYNKITFLLSLDSTVYSGSPQEIGSSTTLYSASWNSNPAGGSWSWTNIDDLLAGDDLYTLGSPSGDGYTYKYQLWVEVDYTAGGASVKPYYYYLNQ